MLLESKRIEPVTLSYTNLHLRTYLFCLSVQDGYTHNQTSCLSNFKAKYRVIPSGGGVPGVLNNLLFDPPLQAFKVG